MLYAVDIGSLLFVPSSTKTPRPLCCPKKGSKRPEEIVSLFAEWVM